MRVSSIITKLDDLEARRQARAALPELERLRLENADLRNLLAMYEARGPNLGIYVADALLRLSGGRFAGHATYADYLKSSEWLATRAWALERAERRCQLCGTSDRLEVHHSNYRNLGRERPSDVIVICRGCHAKHHGIKQSQEPAHA